MIRTLVLIISFFFCNSILSLAQEKYKQEVIDTMTLRKPFSYQKFNHYEAALNSNPKLIGWTYFYTRKAYFHQINRRHDSTLYYANKAIDAFLKLKTPPDSEINYAITSYYMKGVMLNKEFKYKVSTESFIKAMEMIDNFNPKHNYRGYVAYFIAENQNLLGDFNLTQKYAKIAMKAPVFKRLSADYGNVYEYLAFVKEDLKEFDSAVYYYNKARLFFKSKNNIRNVIVNHNNIGDVFRKKGVLDSVKYHFTKANELLEKNELNNAVGGLLDQPKFVKANMAYLKIVDENYNEAENDLKEILKSLENRKINNYVKELKNTCYDYLIECYYRKEEFQKIITVSNQKNKLLVAYQKEFTNSGLQELETKYNVKKKEKKIITLSEENRVQATILNQQKIILGILGLVMVLLCVAGYLFIRQRKLKANYEKVVLQQRLLRSQMNPHFLFNALSSVCEMVNEQSKNTIPYIAKLSKLLRLILKNSRQDFISLKEEKQVLQDYLDLESNFNENFNFKLEAIDSIEEEIICIPPMLVQPFVENCIQHGLSNEIKKGEISILFKKMEHEKLINCIIKDNGIGYNGSSVKIKDQSFSSDIVAERLKTFKNEFKVNCRFEILSNKNKGTEVHLYMPYILDE